MKTNLILNYQVCVYNNLCCVQNFDWFIHLIIQACCSKSKNWKSHLTPICGILGTSGSVISGQFWKWSGFFLSRNDASSNPRIRILNFLLDFLTRNDASSLPRNGMFCPRTRGSMWTLISSLDRSFASDLNILIFYSFWDI